jgi:hypothetical protein
LDGGVDVYKSLNFSTDFADGHVIGFSGRKCEGGSFGRFPGNGCTGKSNQLAKLRATSMVDIESSGSVALKFLVTYFTIEETKRRG